MTKEADAKEKWCPQARVMHHGGEVANRNNAGPVGNCIGSSCMVWRWTGNNPGNNGFCGLGPKPGSDIHLP
jgi:hypothetical protein